MAPRFHRPQSQPVNEGMTPPVGTDIAEVTEFRVKRLEDTAATVLSKLDIQRDRYDEKFDEVSAAILKLTEQVAGTASSVEAMTGTVAQAMELVTASAKGTIQINTTRETVIIEDGADARKTRRAFSLKVLGIVAAIVTAIVGMLQAGRC